MPLWIIEPRDPLIVRDGRPFGPTPGARATTLPFPFPSTVAGGLRTRAGLDRQGRFDPARVEEVKRLEARGPLLVELDEAGEVAEWLAPAPADALLLEHPDGRESWGQRWPLVPLALPEGVQTDLPDGLAPVGPRQHDPRKPPRNTPRFWRWDRFVAWLHSPPKDGDEIELAALGHGGPQVEQRMHVGIDREKRTAREGVLFQTRGLEFTVERRRLGLAVATDAVLRPGLAPLGGERRLVAWRQSQRSLPACPPQVRAAIVRDRACRVLLLTPACFAGGYRPRWLLEPFQGVEARLVGAAVSRPQVVSGWDFASQRPKPTRRLAPAGSVYFLRLEGDSEAIERWVDARWLACVSDEEQDRRDGFGLAALGVWSGALGRMEG